MARTMAVYNHIHLYMKNATKIFCTETSVQHTIAGNVHVCASTVCQQNWSDLSCHLS